MVPKSSNEVEKELQSLNTSLLLIVNSRFFVVKRKDFMKE